MNENNPSKINSDDFSDEVLEGPELKELSPEERIVKVYDNEQVLSIQHAFNRWREVYQKQVDLESEYEELTSAQKAARELTYNFIAKLGVEKLIKIVIDHISKNGVVLYKDHFTEKYSEEFLEKNPGKPLESEEFTEFFNYGLKQEATNIINEHLRFTDSNETKLLILIKNLEDEEKFVRQWPEFAKKDKFQHDLSEIRGKIKELISKIGYNHVIITLSRQFDDQGDVLDSNRQDQASKDQRKFNLERARSFVSKNA